MVRSGSSPGLNESSHPLNSTSNLGEPMFKNESDMQRAAAFVNYEWRQFTWAADEVPRALAAEDSRPGTGGPDPAEDAVIEVMLLHARALRDFFGRGRAELKKYQQTDIVAEDFFDTPGTWTKPTFT